MFTRKGDASSFDSVILAEAMIKRSGGSSSMGVEMVMVYQSSTSLVTYGSCPVADNLLSDEAKEALESFVSLAERDFGELVFGEGSAPGEGGSYLDAGDPGKSLDAKSLGGV